MEGRTMKATDLPAHRVMSWLKANLGKSCLAPLTGTDTKALRAAVQIIELYGYIAQRDEDATLAAFAAIVRQMQRSTQELAYHSIAMLMEWHSRDEIWARAGLEPLERVRVCAYEPGGSAR